MCTMRPPLSAIFALLIAAAVAFTYFFVLPVPHAFSGSANGDQPFSQVAFTFPVGSSVQLHWNVTDSNNPVRFVSLCGWISWVYNATGYSGSSSFVVPNGNFATVSVVFGQKT